jgi:hypothetical protein
MAGVIGVANTSEVALTAATARTVIQIVSAAHSPIKIKEWGVFFDSTSVSAEPVQVRLLRQSSAGTMSSLTPVERTITGVTLTTTAQHTATVEPGAGNVLAVREVHPQSGYQEKFAPGDEIIVGGTSAARIGIECTAPAGVNVRAEIVFEE